MTNINELQKSLENSRGRTIFKQYLAEHINNALLGTFDALTSLYLQVNSVINISALKTPDDIYIKHYLDSIAAHRFFVGDCCDVGCGGGFPCLPLAIVNPNANFLGIDGVGKKLTLINRSASELNLPNIKSLHIRAEELTRTGARFDTVSARAVADTDKVLSYCAPLTKSGGKIVLYKTQNDEKASNAVSKKTKCELFLTEDYTLSGTEIKRRLFVYVKQ